MILIDKKTFTAGNESIKDIITYIEGISFSYLPHKKHLKLLLIADEVISNIIKYAYEKQQQDKSLTIETYCEDNYFILRFVDKGKPFNQLKHIAVNKITDLAQASPGGVGRIFIKTFTDDSKYEYADRQNILTLKVQCN